jgi:hypothetical protein
MTTPTMSPTTIPATQVNNRLTLTIDDNFGFILSKMRTSFPLLKDTDLVKMAVGGFYNQNNSLFARDPDPLEKKAMDDFITNPDLARYSDLKELEQSIGLKLTPTLSTPEEITEFNKEVQDREDYLKSKYKI